MPSDDLQIFAPVGSAISRLLHPHAEVILHDLRSGTIAGIWNGFSGRSVGDDSLLEELEFEGEAVGPYPKVGPKGEALKSVSAVLALPGGEQAGLLCINLDVSRLDEAARLLSALAQTRHEQPAALFAGDWRERIQTELHGWLANSRLTVSTMQRSDRIALVAHLDRQNLFETRNAADHAARLLGISRTSLYNYLRAARARTQKEEKS